MNKSTRYNEKQKKVKNSKQGDEKTEEEKKEEAELKKQLGNRLRELIRSNGYTQENFSRKCGISSNTLKKYIIGKSFYRADVLRIISMHLNVSPEYLLCMTEDPKAKLVPSLADQIKTATNLSPEAVYQLLDMGLRKEKYEEHLKYISLLLEEQGLMKKLITYFRFVENKHVYYISNTKNVDTYTQNEDTISLTKQKLEDFPHLKKVDLENVYLFQFMKEIDNIVKRHLLSKNSKRRLF